MKKLIIVQLFVVIGLLSAQEAILPILDLKTKNLLGSTQSGKFYSPKETYIKLKKSMLKDIFSVYENNEIKEKKIQLKTLKNADDYCTDSFRITTSKQVNTGVAISNRINWSPIPRKIKPLAKNNKVYNEVVKNILISKGFKSPKVSIKQIYSADLNNDKQNEIVIVGEYYQKALVEGEGRRSYSVPGDYSFIMLRTIYKGTVKNILLEGSFNISSIDSVESRVVPNTYELTSILDLNGDGSMEIVIYSYYYEGSFTTAYTLKDGKVKAVLDAGCGS